MAEWNVGNVDLNGTSHTVSMKSPVFGKKTIKVNGDSTEVGLATIQCGPTTTSIWMALRHI